MTAAAFSLPFAPERIGFDSHGVQPKPNISCPIQSVQERSRRTRRGLRTGGHAKKSAESADHSIVVTEMNVGPIRYMSFKALLPPPPLAMTVPFGTEPLPASLLLQQAGHMQPDDLRLRRGPGRMSEIARFQRILG
jgi:hypothetical protein